VETCYTGAIIQRYLGKISGPLLDCVDLRIEVSAVPYKGAARQRVQSTRAIQQRRGCHDSHIPVNRWRKLHVLDDASEHTLEMAAGRMGLSACAHDRILKADLTIADLAAAEAVSARHAAGAVQYRSLDRNCRS